MANRETLINDIISLDADTYQGIDDPSFLAEMSITELEAYLAKMQNDLCNHEPVDFASDAEADADALRGIGWGTDEDYGHYDGDDWD